MKVANIEGTVTALGTLATKVLTPRNEEITIPNALMLSDAATNYSRNADLGVFAPTSVTIGTTRRGARCTHSSCSRPRARRESATTRNR